MFPHLRESERPATGRERKQSDLTSAISIERATESPGRLAMREISQVDTPWVASEI